MTKLRSEKNPPMKNAILLEDDQLMFLVSCMQVAVSLIDKPELLSIAMTGLLATPDLDKNQHEVVQIMETAFVKGPLTRF